MRYNHSNELRRIRLVPLVPMGSYAVSTVRYWSHEWYRRDNIL